MSYLTGKKGGRVGKSGVCASPYLEILRKGSGAPRRPQSFSPLQPDRTSTDSTACCTDYASHHVHQEHPLLVGDEAQDGDIGEVLLLRPAGDELVDNDRRAMVSPSK